MISLTCTHCQTVLSIDEAFAGGVCRCQHCGTIQTVPSHLRAGSGTTTGADSAESSSGSASKTLYKTHPRSEVRAEGTGSGTGLEDLADIVASSGLSSNRLSSSAGGQKRPVKQATPGDAKKSKTPLLVLIGAAAAVSIAVAVWYFAGSATSKLAPPGTPTSGGGETTVATGPNFCGMPITGNSVIYILDRGDSAKSIFDPMKEATYRSIESLGADRKFQVMLWDNKTGDERYPSAEPTFAAKENLDACRRTFEDIVPYRQSTITAPLTRAIEENPDTIVIVTAKGSELDDSFVSEVRSIRKDSKTKIDTISLRDSGSPALEAVAVQSGGVYKVLSDGALRGGSSQ